MEYYDICVVWKRAWITEESALTCYDHAVSMDEGKLGRLREYGRLN